MRDPGLNEAGRQHCIDFKEHLNALGQAKFIDHIRTSPLSLAWETALLALEEVTDRGIKVVALPHLQSLGSGLNGTGMDVAELNKRYGNEEGPEGAIGAGHQFKGKVDLSNMSEGWNCKSDTVWTKDHDAWSVKFIKAFLMTLSAGTPGKRTEVVIVSHSNFMERLLDCELLRKKLLDREND